MSAKDAQTVHSASAGSAGQHRILPVLLCGGQLTGKEALLSRYFYNRYTDADRITMLCIDWKQRPCEVDGELVTFRVVLVPDGTSLTPRYSSKYGMMPTIRPLHYSQAHGIVFTLDVSDERAVKSASRWLQADTDNAGYTQRDPNIARLLLATKVDKPGRVVHRARGEALAAEFSAGYAECSSATGEGVQEAFAWIAGQANQRWKRHQAAQSERLTELEKSEQKQEHCVVAPYCDSPQKSGLYKCSLQ